MRGRKEKAKPVEMQSKHSGTNRQEHRYQCLWNRTADCRCEYPMEPTTKEEPGQSLSSSVQFETFEHERENVIPIFEYEITQQGIQVLKKGSASSQSLANGAVLLIHQV